MQIGNVLSDTDAPVLTSDNKPQLLVEHDLVYISGYLGSSLYTLNAKDGTLLWHYDIQKTGTAAPPSLLALENGTAYVIGNNDEEHNTLKALRKQDGKEIWHYDMTLPLSATVSNGVLYVQTIHSLKNDPEGRYKEQKSLTALDASTGQRIWSVIAPANNAGPLVVIDKNIVLFNGKAFCAYHSTSGTQAWCTKNTQSALDNEVSLLADNGVIYSKYEVSSKGLTQLIQAINGNNGHLFWSKQVDGVLGSSLFVSTNEGLVIPDAYNLVVVSRHDGHTLWKMHTKDWSTAITMVATGS